MAERTPSGAIEEIRMSGRAYGMRQAQTAEVIHGLMLRDIDARSEGGPTKGESQVLDFFSNLINAHGGSR